MQIRAILYLSGWKNYGHISLAIIFSYSVPIYVQVYANDDADSSAGPGDNNEDIEMEEPRAQVEKPSLVTNHIDISPCMTT